MPPCVISACKTLCVCLTQYVRTQTNNWPSASFKTKSGIYKHGSKPTEKKGWQILRCKVPKRKTDKWFTIRGLPKNCATTTATESAHTEEFMATLNLKNYFLRFSTLWKEVVWPERAYENSLPCRKKCWMKSNICRSVPPHIVSVALTEEDFFLNYTLLKEKTKTFYKS